MKTKLYAALVAFVAIAGLISASSDAVAEPTCPGTGIECARSWDGTTYFKGSGHELEQAN